MKRTISLLLIITVVFGSLAVNAAGINIPAVPCSVFATAVSPKGSTKVSWKAVSGATGYVVYRSASKTKGFTRLKVTKSTSYVTTGKLFFYKVRAYKTVNGKNVYGTPSKAFSTPEIPVDGLKSKMPGAKILQAWKLTEGETAVVVQKLSCGSSIKTSYKGVTCYIPQVCFIAVITCKPDHFGSVSAWPLLGKTGIKKNEALVNEIAIKKGALIAINNEVFSGHWNLNVPSAFLCDGPVVKDGIVVQNKGKEYSTFAMYKDGTWLKDKIINPQNVNSEISNGLSYTQTHVQNYIWNSNVLTHYGYQNDLLGDGNNALRNRTMYGQVDATHYLLIVGEFMQCDTMTDILLRYGAKNGFQTNGGNCSYMYMKGVGNVTGTNAPQLTNLNKLNVLEQEWLGSHNLLNGGKGAACPAVDIVYVK